MSNFTTELIKNLSNNVSVEEFFRVELEKAFNQLLETESDCFLGYEKYSKNGYNTGDSRKRLEILQAFITKIYYIKNSSRVNDCYFFS